jgi:hypothetical protein
MRWPQFAAIARHRRIDLRRSQAPDFCKTHFVDPGFKSDYDKPGPLQHPLLSHRAQRRINIPSNFFSSTNPTAKASGFLIIQIVYPIVRRSGDNESSNVWNNIYNIFFGARFRSLRNKMRRCSLALCARTWRGNHGKRARRLEHHLLSSRHSEVNWRNTFSRLRPIAAAAR